jgi:histidinol-phosphate aminotransferase
MSATSARNFTRPMIQSATGYVPGEQIEDTGIIKLNTNENPYPPAPALRQALQSFDLTRLRQYPQPTALTFRDAAASMHGVSPQCILATNGGDELLRLAITTFVDPGEHIGYANPSYSLYPVLAELHGAKVFDVPLDERWHPGADFAQRMNEANAKLVFVVNPHAPSGTLLDVNAIETLARELNGVLVLDEAYVDFVDPALKHNAIPLVKRLDNVLILRSFSKGYSLAGLRFGYGIGSANLIEPMQSKTKDSYNTDVLGQLLATTALSAREYAQGTWGKVRDSRTKLTEDLTARGYSVEPSHANFVLATVPKTPAPSAQQLYEGLKARGILVRYFGLPRLEQRLRITIGTPAENAALLDALDALGG